MKTFSLRKEDVKETWYLVNAEGRTLGRMATEIASLLRGKTSPEFTPHVASGNHVVVINAEKVRVTGKKLEKKQYFKHTMYPGGMSLTSMRKLMSTKPEQVIKHAVKGMVPKTKLGKTLMFNLKVYKGPNHPHSAQRPQVFEVRG